MGNEALVQPGGDPESRRSRVRACLLGGAIGDALGAPIEFMTLSRIRREFGPQGVSEMVGGEWPAGTITDDTQMTLFTAEGLLRARTRADERGFCHPPGLVCHAYLRWLITQGMQPAFTMDRAYDGLLLGVPALYAQRAPGNTCLSALAAMTSLNQGTAANHSKGCGGVMRSAPVGLFAVAHGQSFEWGRDFAALTHGHPTGSLAAGAFAMLIELLFAGQSLSDAIPAVTATLGRFDQHQETLAAINLAVVAAQSGPASAEAVERLGGGWVAEEALGIAIYCALKTTSFEEGVLLAVNHGGDSDSTGSIAGNLLGLIHGEQSLPQRWLNPLELRDLIARVAEDLVDSPDYRSIPKPADGDFEEAVWQVYPGY